jgi:hypothetical protein
VATAYEGFDLHADVAIAAEDRPRLEPLCRYVLRPPVVQERLTLLPDGRVLAARAIMRRASSSVP